MLTAKKTLICSLAFANISYALSLNDGEEVATNDTAAASTTPVPDDAEGEAIARVQELMLQLAEASAPEHCHDEVGPFLRSLPPVALVGALGRAVATEVLRRCVAGGAPWEALLTEAEKFPLKDFAAGLGPQDGHALAQAHAMGEEGAPLVLAQLAAGQIESLVELAFRIESAASGDNGEACWRHTELRPPRLRTSCHHLPGQEFRGLGDAGWCYPIGSGEGFVWDAGYVHPWPTDAVCPPDLSFEDLLCYP